jgi:hypothetical protein
MIIERRLRTDLVKQKGRESVVDEQMVSDWISGPAAAIPLEPARRWLDQNRAPLHEADLGARRLSCNWEFDSREEGSTLPIGEVQEMRSLARGVALRARVAIRDGKYDEAVLCLQTGFAMARHVSQGPNLILPLVGSGLTMMMTRTLEDLIQAPGSPNLFWAMAGRPRPFIDVAEALEGERFQLEREIPRLRELDSVPWSVEKARAFRDELESKLFRLAGMGVAESSAAPSLGLKDWSLQLGMAALVAQTYPEAKRALIAQGRSPAEVEAMPAVQVAALYTFRSYQELRDDVFKWSGLPYSRASKGMDDAWLSRNAELQRRPLLRLFTVFLPSIGAACLAPARVDRQLDALQCIEAIRIHAAAHQKLPARLDEVLEAPVPIDPLTGQPFAYQVDGDRATLSAPYPPGGPAVPGYGIHYELKLIR